MHLVCLCALEILRKIVKSWAVYLTNAAEWCIIVMQGDNKTPRNFHEQPRHVDKLPLCRGNEDTG